MVSLQPTRPRVWRITYLLVSSVGLGCFAYLLATNFITAYNLLLGGVVALPLIAVVLVVRRVPRAWLLIGLLALIVALIIIALLQPQYLGSRSPATPWINDYRVVIEPVDASMRLFTVKERVSVSESERDGEFEIVNLPEWQGTTRTAGAVLREVRFTPLTMDSEGWVSIALPGGGTREGLLCVAACPEARIELLDFPKGSFFQARYAERLESNPYQETETIRWSSSHLNRGVAFTYAPREYRFLRRVLLPPAGISSAVGFVRLLGSLLGLVAVDTG